MIINKDHIINVNVSLCCSCTYVYNGVCCIQNIAFSHPPILVRCSFLVDCGVSLCGGQGHVPEVLHSYVVTATGPTPLHLHGSRGEHDTETKGE